MFSWISSAKEDVMVACNGGDPHVRIANCTDQIAYVRIDAEKTRISSVEGEIEVAVTSAGGTSASVKQGGKVEFQHLFIKAGYYPVAVESYANAQVPERASTCYISCYLEDGTFFGENRCWNTVHGTYFPMILTMEGGP